MTGKTQQLYSSKFVPHIHIFVRILNASTDDFDFPFGRTAQFSIRNHTSKRQFLMEKCNSHFSHGMLRPMRDAHEQKCWKTTRNKRFSIFRFIFFIFFLLILQKSITFLLHI